jgi:hypothetical protein
MPTVIHDLTDLNISMFLDECSPDLRSKIIALKQTPGKVIVNLTETLSTDLYNELYNVTLNHDPSLFSEFRIMSLINSEFLGFPLENIDFARHLKKDIALNKKVFKDNNGRPTRSEYYNDNDLVAEIEFIFTLTSSNLVQRRQEYLRYYRDNGTKSDSILIKDRIYDFTNLVDGELAVQERIDSRHSIVASMKAFLSNILMQALIIDMDQAVITIKPFWDEYHDDIDSFVELGVYNWRDGLIAIDLASTPYTWLAVPVDGEGTTIRDYMVARISY